MTSYTAVVLGKASHENLLKEVRVVPLDANHLIVIVVTDKGKVEHKNITLDNVSPEDIKKTVELINNLIVGTPIDEVSTKLEFEIKPIISKYVEGHQQLYNAIYNVFNDITNTDINVVGRTKFLEQPEKEILQEIKKDDSNNIEVYIGSENKLDDDVTIIKTNFKTDSEEGTLAIIGPKRMEYDRVVSILEYLKENIER